MYDLIIIGAGPAGTAAGVYAARKQLKTLLITKDYESQSVVSPEIYNWIGTPAISGIDLAKSFQAHLEEYTSKGYLEIKTGDLVSKVKKESQGFSIETEKGIKYQAKVVLVASGSGRRKLNVPGSTEFENKGIVYCATCDGPLFAGQNVAVIGGGNAGFETAAQLTAYAKSVTLLHRGSEYKADQITVKKVLAKENMTGILNAQTTEIAGDKFVEGINYKNKDEQDVNLEVTGVFVEIGQIPNTGIVDGLVELDDYKKIIIDPWNQRTSVEGVWAAGDCSNVRYHQNNISAGDAVKALEDIYMWLHRQN